MSGLRGTNVEKSNVHAVPKSWHGGSAQSMAELSFLVCLFVLKVHCLELVPFPQPVSPSERRGPADVLRVPSQP